MLSRLLQDRLRNTTKSILLLGPRQVGKSTLCLNLKPDRVIQLADEGTFLAYSKDPARLRRELQAAPADQLTILIDEIQRVPSLLNTIQSLIDAPGNRRRFLLTGSNARKLRKAGANLLPGRVILEHLDPLTWSEAGNSFDLERALQVGMLPGVYLDREDGAAVLGTYAEVYLREEIRAEALVKDVGGYARFLDVAAILSGQWLNYSKISSDIEIPKETIRRYVEVLEDTLLIFRLPSFQPKLKISRRVSQRDKWILFDVGVRNALLGLHTRPISADQRGAVFEQWFILQLIYLNRALKRNWSISAYRTESGAEVDVVVETSDEIIGIEIKASRNISATDCRGLRSLGEVVGKYKPYRKWIVYLGETEQILDDGTWGAPYLTALRAAKDLGPV